MNNVGTILENMMKYAKRHEDARQAFLASQNSADPYDALCKAARQYGFELYTMDLIDAEDAFLTQLAKSVNGGGANHYLMTGQGEFYAQFIASIGDDQIGK